MNAKVVAAHATTAADATDQALVLVDAKDKHDALRALLTSDGIPNALIFCNRKRAVNRLFRRLVRNGFNAGLLHGNLDPATRAATLNAFARGDVAILVCAGAIACQLNIPSAHCVVNVDAPTNGKSYRRRIDCAHGPSRVITFATADDGDYVAAIESAIGRPLPRKTIDHLTDPSSGRSSKGRKKSHARNAAAGPSQAKPTLSAAFGDDVPAFLLRAVKLP